MKNKETTLNKISLGIYHSGYTADEESDNYCNTAEMTISYPVRSSATSKAFLPAKE
jgi:hypothetical protein